MPKRTDLKSILIIGSGPIIIGQACEFDYSGVQACKALREEGYRVILVNSNPATIMTDPDVADATYIEPIEWTFIEQIIAKERPDAILPTMGGQTALNVSLDLAREGVLEKYDIELIGATKEAIDKAEDRDLFNKAMDKIGLEMARSSIAHNMEEALKIQKDIGFPIIIRPSFTLGGTGGGIAYNLDDFMEICEGGFESSPTNELLIEESLIGWKEYEMEVIRDNQDNCIIVCSIENLDPMGVHTGDSITVAPAQTLTDKEYQVLRNASIEILREIGVDTGGSNVQFAIDPKTGRLIVIEMNPRVSRSSALASKATGFPIAKVAAKLAVGYSLNELQNEITGGKTPASFEPSIDYFVTKIPRFNFEKFPQTTPTLTTQMKAVGEVMAMGRTFTESMQKALRSLETGIDGFTPIVDFEAEPDLNSLFRSELQTPKPERLLYLADALRAGYSPEQIISLSHIDPWFVHQIKYIIDMEQEITELQKDGNIEWDELTQEKLLHYKRNGFSDSRIASLLNTDEHQIRGHRKKLGINPVFKRVDTCAAEFPTNTAYLYSTYEQFCEGLPSDNPKIMVLGSGPNRIGQGIEFDYSCVHASMALKENGFETIMVNCNPETVSTDFDTSDRLYFEPLTLEDVMAIVELEKPQGVIVQYGGQTPLKLANSLEALGVPIIGTSAKDIDRAEDREKFQQIIHDLQLKQPENRTAISIEDGLSLAEEIGYPIIVRPSYVLGGRAMEIVYNKAELKNYFQEAVDVSNQCPVLLDRFLNDAIEVDVDAVSDGKDILIGGIMEHIEEAGVHSGDSACSLPAFSLSDSIQQELLSQTIKLTKALNVIGLINIQFAIKGEDIYLLEVNPRCSRTIPFVSKAIGLPLAKIGALAMAGRSLAEQGYSDLSFKQPNFYSVKEAVFPFNKFPGSDPILGPEMKSTGEVMGIGQSFAEAYKRAQFANKKSLEPGKKAFLSVKDSDKDNLVPIAQSMSKLGFELCATRGTARTLEKAGLVCERVNKVIEGRPHIVDMLKNNEVDYIVNTTEGKQAIEDSCSIRRTALQQKVLYTTTLSGARAACQAMEIKHLTINPPLQSLHKKEVIS